MTNEKQKIKVHIGTKYIGAFDYVFIGSDTKAATGIFHTGSPRVFVTWKDTPYIINQGKNLYIGKSIRDYHHEQALFARPERF